MSAVSRSVHSLLALAFLAGGPAAAQTQILSNATASSADEIFEPFDIAEDYDEDATDVAGQAVNVGASACLSPCVVPPPHQSEAEGHARSDFGENEVEVYAQSWSDSSNWSYHDVATAGSFWEDELTFTSDDPGATGSVRATFRIQGSWQNRACFAFVGYFYDPASESSCTDQCCPCYTIAAAQGLENQSVNPCELVSPVGGGFGFPGSFPDYDEQDGDVDHFVTVELPLILDRPVRFGAALAGATAGFDFSALVSGVEAAVTELDVPAGVAVDSAANALSAYNLPEPGPGAAGAASALALAALRRRRRREAPAPR
jgi:hypothetical protein